MTPSNPFQPAFQPCSNIVFTEVGTKMREVPAVPALPPSNPPSDLRFALSPIPPTCAPALERRARVRKKRPHACGGGGAIRVEPKTQETAARRHPRTTKERK
jgi:hypothetical protein